MNDRNTLALLRNIADSYPEGSPGRLAALGQLDAFAAHYQIVDSSAYLDPEADATRARAEVKGDRRPSPGAVARVRPFGREARRQRAARIWASIAIAALTLGALITVAAGTLASAQAGGF